MRKLASIQQIESITPIMDADAIELVKVLGWQVVVKKGEFQVGDKVVYCEIDSVLPQKDEFKFLEKVNYRIKTIKLRGCISQGICFPLSILPTGEYNIDDEVTEIIGITKYEPAVHFSLGGEVKGNFPHFIPKTDEPRVQNMYRVLNEFSGIPAYISLKLDGSSSTFYLNNGTFGVCSRNLELTENESNAFWEVAKRLNIKQKLQDIGDFLQCNVAMSGELCGPRIQQNLLKLPKNNVYFFNLFNIDTQEYFNGETLRTICEQFRLDMVPVLDWNHVIQSDSDYYVNYVNGLKHSIYQNKQAEGVVIRPIVEQYYNNARISFKAINNKFLLSNE